MDSIYIESIIYDPSNPVPEKEGDATWIPAGCDKLNCRGYISDYDYSNFNIRPNPSNYSSNYSSNYYSNYYHSTDYDDSFSDHLRAWTIRVSKVTPEIFFCERYS